MTTPSPWWTPHVHADRRPLLLARARIKAAIRAWFAAEGFIEVETACLQISPGNETHLHAFRTELVGTDLARAPRYLHTSPEFAMKKLLAAGEQKIFTFAPAFRNRERGPLHAPEFTMLEWYRSGAGYETLWDDCASLVRIAAEATDNPVWSWRGRVVDTRLEPVPISVQRAFERHLGLPAGAPLTLDTLSALARHLGHTPASDETVSALFSRLVTMIEPALGIGAPTLLTRYPASEAALARRAPDDDQVAERFELYACGVELANGFGELTDPAEQRRRLEAEMDEKQRIYGERYPIDDDFLAALALMPAASGCALGFDRLILLATGAARIDDVVWTPSAH